tara:strand:- start:5512 stop:5763 length:252 start_codon:yes stop_codon:yes gene_type:complete
MINLENLTATEAEALAYSEGFTGTARQFARISDLQRALGQAVAALEAISESNNDTMNAKQRRGAAAEALAIIGESINLWELER